MDKRLCVVGEKTGYFHMLEQYSMSVQESILKGGSPGGVVSRVYGIVEFDDSVRRVEPTEIIFCDQDNSLLRVFNKNFYLKGE